MGVTDRREGKHEAAAGFDLRKRLVPWDLDVFRGEIRVADYGAGTGFG